MLKIKKRDGRYVKFNEVKIKAAIFKAFKATNHEIDEAELDILVKEVVRKVGIQAKNKIPQVEQVQDVVELVLMKDYPEVAKNYIIYRNDRSLVRDKQTRLMKTYQTIGQKSDDNDLKRENANVDGDTAMGAMLQYGSEGAKEYNKLFVLKPEHAKAHDNGDIHIHDLDFLTLTMTCCQIDLTKLFKDGFQTGHGSIREPKTIQTYAALAAIAIQSNQNDQHGGQAVPQFDYDMANGVRKSYIKRYREALQTAFDLYSINKNAKEELSNIEKEHNVLPKLLNTEIDQYIRPMFRQEDQERVINFLKEHARKEVTNDTYQAMESFVHNLNTMHSRAGAQVPFSSINYGTDTSAEGRLVMEQLMLTTQKGLGKGETPIFPIQIFKIKDGVNFKEGDPNYDLFKLACETSSQRLFPNFSFIDAPHNIQYYKEGRPETEIAYMGCRTRVMGNNYDPKNEIVNGRGNLSFTSINLPRLALKTKNVDKFFKELDKMIDLVIDQLLERFKIQSNLHVYNFPFLMGQHVWIGSDKLKPSDKIGEVIKHGSLTCGFIGLAETLKALTGKHHGESDESQELGIKIISHMRKRMDDASKKYGLNFSLIASPAEGLSGRFVKMDKKIFGEIEGITNHLFYTNSFHIPVYYKLPAYVKIEKESKYHPLTNGGHITYIELAGDASNNPEAFYKIVKYMKEQGIGYGSINHAVDFDPCCGYRGIIGDECPKCHRRETKDYKFDRIRRITGYLVGSLNRFNDAKRKEVEERVKHA